MTGQPFYLLTYQDTRRGRIIYVMQTPTPGSPWCTARIGEWAVDAVVADARIRKCCLLLRNLVDRRHRLGVHQKRTIVVVFDAVQAYWCRGW
jgi:hypothetical protein